MEPCLKNAIVALERMGACSGPGDAIPWLRALPPDTTCVGATTVRNIASGKRWSKALAAWRALAGEDGK